MKKETLRNRSLLAMLSLLGFAGACSDPTCEYGVPRARFRISGTVTDHGGNPIPNIKIESETKHDFVRTSPDGRFDLASEGNTGAQLFTVCDDDGPANGGDFETGEITVEFTEADRTAEGDNWYAGSFSKTGIEVVLDEKK